MFRRYHVCDVLRLEAIVVQCVEVGNVGFSLGSLVGFRFFLGIQVCWRTGGDMHLTSGAVQCRVLESLV